MSSEQDARELAVEVLSLVVSVVSWLVIFGIGLLVMIKGWGLTPHSWFWIVSGWAATIVCVMFPPFARSFMKGVLKRM